MFFTVKSPSVTHRLVSQEMLVKRAKPIAFFSRNTIGSNNSFTLIENNFRFLRLWSLNSIHYGLWAKCTQLWLLNMEMSLHVLNNKTCMYNYSPTHTTNIHSLWIWSNFHCTLCYYSYHPLLALYCEKKCKRSCSFTLPLFNFLDSFHEWKLGAENSF